MSEINKIKRISLCNVKGKSTFEVSFDELHANYPNLLIAPNGFGKSTIAVAFEALKPNKIELNKDDLFDGKEDNEPALEIELEGDNASILAADSIKNEINKIIDTYVINSPIYAKGTARRMGGFTTSSATLDVEDLVFLGKIPAKAEIKYSASNIRNKFGVKGKIFQNISGIFSSLKNLQLLYNNYALLDKCTTQKKPEIAINSFLDIVVDNGTVEKIKQRITDSHLDLLRKNNSILELSLIIQEFDKLPFKKDNQVELFLTTIQLIEVVKDNLSSIKKAYFYAKYQNYRNLIDNRLDLYNTTGRTIKTKETKGKLVVEFLTANKMSNGERDVLSFISNLSKFETDFNKNIGILIIDEIFDYLDGSNILIVQYYLSRLIQRSKEMGKILFPLILTHLDPAIFGNYYFKKPKVHYLKKYACTKDNDMLTFLRIRNKNSSQQTIKDKIEAYYLHFNQSIIHLSAQEKTFIDNPSYHDSSTFYGMINREIGNYLSGKENYDPLKVICAIRIRVEEIIFKRLSKVEDEQEYLKKHTTTKKLEFAVEQGVNVHETLFLLQPLYNDGLHMDENEYMARNKIQSACLKLDNNIIRNIVSKLF